jgi:hypothetical protein
MVQYDSSNTRARGLDTDKENIQINKPHRKNHQIKRSKMNDENNGPVNSFHLHDNLSRKPF